MPSEALLNYSIVIVLPNGSTITDRQLACSIYHAIEKSFTVNSCKQMDRSKYKAVKSLIKTK